MKRIFLLLMLHFLLHTGAMGQENLKALSLERAIEIAMANNLLVRQSNIQLAAAKVDYSQARANLLPDVNAAVTHGINQGRSIDPFTNSYIDQEIRFGAYGVGASLLLFNGLNVQQTIRQNSLAYDASKLELEQARDNLSLSIMLTYLQVLNNEDVVEMARKQVAVTQEQLNRLETLNEQGAIGPPVVAELRGQLKGEELALVNAKQALELAKLALAQLMNVPYSPAMQLERVEVETLMDGQGAPAPGEVYTAAVNQLALVKAAHYRQQSAAAGVRAARALYYPSLFLNGNINSNYSSAATINGEEIFYNDQLRNNLFSSVSLSLRIPILNAFSTHYGVRRAKLNLQQAGLAEETTRVQLRQDVEQAELNFTNARERYQILQDQEKAFAEAFRAAEIRFNAGAGTPVDYLIAKNNLDRSRINLLTAKYDYLLRLKILDFYTGK